MSFTVISAATSSERRLAYVVSRWSGHPRNDHRLLFVTDGAGEEHLLKTAAYPLGWTPRGVITAGVAWSHVELRVWRADGRPVAPTRTMRVSASIWDWSTNRFYAISHGRVIRSDGISATSLARVQSLGFAGPSLVFLSSLGNGLIEVSSTSRLVLLDAAGRTRFRAKLPRGWRLGGSIAAERDGTVAYEAVPSTKQAARHFRLYAALPGGRPRLLDRYDVAPACVPHSLQLRGSAVLLYASDGFARLYDARVSSAPADLAPAMRWLRARHRTGQPSFA
ncbi:MAG TPA: hypothetical protein VFD90_14635 [Gaiellales bacterium]|nr:hypothetical protein [Gaiellales bacterium]